MSEWWVSVYKKHYDVIISISTEWKILKTILYVFKITNWKYQNINLCVIMYKHTLFNLSIQHRAGRINTKTVQQLQAATETNAQIKMLQFKEAKGWKW